MSREGHLFLKYKSISKCMIIMMICKVQKNYDVLIHNFVNDACVVIIMWLPIMSNCSHVC